MSGGHVGGDGAYDGTEDTGVCVGVCVGLAMLGLKVVGVVGVPDGEPDVGTEEGRAGASVGEADIDRGADVTGERVDAFGMVRCCRARRLCFCRALTQVRKFAEFQAFAVAVTQILP